MNHHVENEYSCEQFVTVYKMADSQSCHDDGYFNIQILAIRINVFILYNSYYAKQTPDVKSCYIIVMRSIITNSTGN